MAAFCTAKGWQVAKVVQEGGAGVNDQRPQCLALLADTRSSHLVVEQQDRCSRFGVAYMQTLLNPQGREVVRVNEAQAGPEDVLQDFVAMITALPPRRDGRRRASRKKTHVLAALEVHCCA